MQYDNRQERFGQDSAAQEHYGPDAARFGRSVVRRPHPVLNGLSGEAAAEAQYRCPVSGECHIRFRYRSGQCDVPDGVLHRLDKGAEDGEGEILP